MPVFSTDTDPKRYSVENLQKLQEHFKSDSSEDTVISDDTFARYLVARGNNVAEAILQIERVRTWRAMNCPIYKEDIVEYLKKGIIVPHGFDKTGHPLIIIRTCLHNPKERNLVHFAKMVIWTMDYTIQKLMPDGKSQFSILLDRTDVKDSDMDFMKNFSGIFKDLYAERLKSTVVNPVGMVFYGLWTIAKLFLDPPTREKVNPCMYQSGLQDFVDAKYLPKHLGGTSEYVFDEKDYDLDYSATSPVGKGSVKSEEPFARQFSEEEIASDSGKEAFFNMSDKVTSQKGWNRFVI